MLTVKLKSEDHFSDVLFVRFIKFSKKINNIGSEILNASTDIVVQ